MNYSLSSKNIVIALILLGLSLAMGCGSNGGSPTTTKGSTTPGKLPPPGGEEQLSEKTVDGVFAAVRDYALGLLPLDSLEAKFTALSGPELNELAKKQDADGRNFTSYLVKGVAKPKTASILSQFFNQISPEALDAQLSAVNGKTPWMLLNDYRPPQEDAADRQSMKRTILLKKPVLVNELKKADGSFNDDDFSWIMVGPTQEQTKTIFDKLDPAHFSAWLLKLVSDAVNRPFFKTIYLKADKTRQEQMHNELLKALYGKPELADIVSSFDHWGLRNTVETDTYALSNNARVYRGNLLCVLAQRALADATAGPMIQLISLDPLLLAASHIKNKLAGAYENHATTVACEGAASVKAALDAGLTNRFAVFSRYYLDLPHMQLSLMEAAAEPAVGNGYLNQLQSSIFAADPAAVDALSQINLGTGRATYLQLLMKRDVDNRHPATEFMRAMVARGLDLDAQLLDVGPDGSVMQMALDPGLGGAAPLIDMLRDWLFEHAQGATIDASVDQASLEALVERYYVGRIANAGRARFKEVHAKVNAANQVIMHSKLLNLAFGDMGEFTSLIADIAAGNNYGLTTDLATDVYRLNSLVGGVTHDGTLLFVLAKRAIEDDRALVANAYSKVFLVSVLFQPMPSGYEAYATTDTSTGGVQGGQSAYSLLTTELVTSRAAIDQRHGYPEYYLRLASRVTEELVMKAVDQSEAAVENKVLRGLYDLGIDADITNAKASNLAGRTGPNVADNFLNRLVSRSMDSDSRHVLTSFLASINDYEVQAGHDGDDVVGSMLAANGAISATSALEKLLVGPRPAGEDVDRLKDLIVFLVKSEDPSLIAGRVTGAQVDNLLEYVLEKGSLSELVKACKVAVAQLPRLAKWFAAHRTDSIITMAGNANRTELASAYLASYAMRPVGEQKILHDEFFKEVYRLGAIAGVQTAIDHVADAIGRRFLSQQDFKANTFDLGAGDKTLADAVLTKALTAGALSYALVNKNGAADGFASQLKSKFTGPTAAADWQRYLDDNNIVNLVEPSAGDQATARTWLAY